MAGAAPQQRGGTNATTIGLVVAVIVSVALLGALIWLFTQQEQLRTTADSAVKARDRLNREKGEISQKAKMLTSLLTGVEEDAPSVAAGKLTDLVERIREDEKLPATSGVSVADGAVAVIETVYQAYVEGEETRRRAGEEVDRINDELAAALSARDDITKAFDTKLAEIEAKVAELQQAKSEFESIKNREAAAFASQVREKQDSLDSLRRERSKIIRDAESELARLESMITEQRQAIAVYRSEGIAQEAKPLAVARRPVGHILRALPGDSLVHIDLGREDRVPLGMTFSVYSEDERVPVDGRGKATIQVVSIGRRTAECRITTPPSPDDPILEGDRVGNIVLSRFRAKKTRICIVGDFDVDFDGQADVRGREAMVALVKRYGAQVVPSVDALTDYVVVGLEPSGGSEDFEEAFAPDAPGDEDEADVDDEYEEDDEEASDFDDDAEGEDEQDEQEDQADESDQIALRPPQFNSRLGRSAEIDPTVAPKRRRLKSARERYFEALRRAELFEIPRLPQDHFLYFVGLEPGPGSTRRLLQR